MKTAMQNNAGISQTNVGEPQSLKILYKALTGKTPTRAELIEAQAILVKPAVISKDWPRFAKKLAATLGKLEEDQFLIIDVKGTSRYVQFSCQGAFGFRVETTSNSYLPGLEQLSELQVAALIDEGWQEPTALPADSTPEKDPDGSPNFYIDPPAGSSMKEMANLAVRTFAEILRVPHPGELEYQCFDKDGNSISLPGLGLKRAVRPDSSDQRAKVGQWLRDVMREITDIADLEFDSDGDIGITYQGSITAFVRLDPGESRIRMYSFLLTEVDESPKLLSLLNKLNVETSGLRLFNYAKSVLAVVELPAQPFFAEQVVQCFGTFIKEASEIHDQLQVNYPYASGNPAMSKLVH